MRVLITGNKGYIGSVMSEYLKKQGHEVFGMDVGFFETCELYASEHFSTFKADIRDINRALFFKNLDAVIHLAGLSNDPLGNMKQSLTYGINWLSSITLALLARDAGVKRFLFASSCSMYGAGDGDKALDETCPQKPLTAYAQSKVWAEKGISRLATDDFSPVFFRCGTAYGTSPRQRLDLVLNKMVADAHLKGRINVYGSGNSWRPIVHVEDISQAFSLGLSAPKEIIHNQAFNVGVNRHNYKIIDLADIVSELTQADVVFTNDENDARSYKVSFNKIKTELGFEPQWNPKRGALQLLNAYKSYDLKYDDKYIRLNHLNNMIQSGKVTKNLRWA